MIKKVLPLCIGFMLLSQIVNAQIAMTEPANLQPQQPLISVNFVRTPLPKVLHTIAQKVHVGLSYKTKTVPSKPVTYDAKKIPVYSALDAVLKGTDLYYTLSDNQKVILIKQRPHLSSLLVKELDATVSGTVTNAQTGAPMIGVNILVIGTTTGTVTDANGHYSITVPSLQDTLRFSFIGFKTQTVPINGRTSINIQLKPAVVSGEKLVVIGYGTQKKEDLTSSVAVVDSKALTEVSSVNIGQSLQGQVAGAQVIQQGGGVPGGKPTIHIRGINSINTNTEPLYVVDGVVGVPHALTTINPQDIASLSVLKGPSATAMYGARGANGVIVITTKKGVSGEVQISYSGRVSVGIMQRHMFAATADQLMYIYVQAMNNSAKYSTDVNRRKDYRACCNTGKSFADLSWLFKQVPKGSYIISLKGDDGNYYAPRFHTNWEDLMFSPSVSNNQYLSIRGGSEKATYSLSLGYTNNEGLMRESFFKRYTGSLTGSIQALDWLNIKTKLSFAKNKHSHDRGVCGRRPNRGHFFR